MSNVIEYKDMIAFHPGYYIRDLIDDQEITQEELAKRLQTTPETMSDLVNGQINLTDDMAIKLSTLFGTSVSMWLNLNRRYLEKKMSISNVRAN